MVLALAACALLQAGCATTGWDWKKPIPWGAGENGELEKPIKLVAMWTDTVLTSSNAPAIRGFGGRLMFYGNDDSPIKVKGTLSVYAFNEEGRDLNNVTPDRKYVFTAEQVAKHYSKGNLGHSYSFWLPWDELGGDEVKISLVCRFTHESGEIVVGEQTTHVLPGKKPAKPPATNAPQPLAAAAGSANTAGGNAGSIQQAAYLHPGQSMPAGVQPAIYEGAMAPGQSPAAQMQMTTTTIELPRYRTPSAMPRPNFPSAISSGAAQTPPAGANLQAPAAHGVQTPTRASEAASNERPEQPTARFGPDRYRALGGPIAPLQRDHALRRPYPVGWPSGYQP
jgi:hypothetical protein